MSITTTQQARAQAILAKDDPTAAAFNAGYDDYPNNLNPFEPETSLMRSMIDENLLQPRTRPA